SGQAETVSLAVKVGSDKAASLAKPATEAADRPLVLRECLRSRFATLLAASTAQRIHERFDTKKHEHQAQPRHHRLSDYRIATFHFAARKHGDELRHSHNAGADATDQPDHGGGVHGVFSQAVFAGQHSKNYQN